MDAQVAPITERSLNGGEQKVYRFDNGFGASVVRGPYTYGGDAGLFEVAVVKFHGDGANSFKITYDTPITDDVLGYQTDEDVADVLAQIAALDA